MDIMVTLDKSRSKNKFGGGGSKFAANRGEPYIECEVRIGCEVNKLGGG